MKFFFLCFLLSPSLARAEYHEISRFNLGGDGGWDLLTLDDSGSRLYLSRSDRVMVVDARKGNLLGEVKGIDGSHGIVVLPKRNIGFATAGKAGTVVVFDLSTFKEIKSIKVGEKPDAILYDSFSEKVFSFNGKSGDISVIDPVSQAVVSTIKLPGRPELPVSDEAGRIYVNLADEGALAVIDVKDLKVLATHSLKPCEDPSGLAIDKNTGHLFVGCGNKMAAMVDGHSGKVLKTQPAGDGIDGAAFDSSRKLAYFPAGKDGKVDIFEDKGSTLRLSQVLTTQKGSRTIALDPSSGQIFLPAAKFSVPTGTQKRGAVEPGSFSVLVYGP